MQGQQPAVVRQQWTTGLCDCTRNCNACCIGCWVPCLVYGENGRKLTGKTDIPYLMDIALYYVVCMCSCAFFVPYCWGCQCLLGMERRKELRRKFGLPEDPCNDCCVHCCCHLCALCQESRELDARGYAEPTIDPIPVVQQSTMQPGFAVPPPQQHYMQQQMTQQGFAQQPPQQQYMQQVMPQQFLAQQTHEQKPTQG